MIVTRFCSEKEYQDFLSGKGLVNDTDHYRWGKGGSTSRGFCFTADKPRDAWRYLKGCIPPPDVCMVLDIPDNRLTKSFGKYPDYSFSPPRPSLKVEFCLTSYSKQKAKLIEVLRPDDFSNPEEMAAAAFLYKMTH